ncbi:Retrovirus-related Pol polyprotein from transposon 17.6, partial [Eumeta japonica]
MERALKSLHWKTCLVYLDDIIVMEKSFDNHPKNLSEDLQQISSAELKPSLKKCELFQR